MIYSANLTPIICKPLLGQLHLGNTADVFDALSTPAGYPGQAIRESIFYIASLPQNRKGFLPQKFPAIWYESCVADVLHQCLKEDYIIQQGNSTWYTVINTHAAALMTVKWSLDCRSDDENDLLRLGHLPLATAPTLNC